MQSTRRKRIELAITVATGGTPWVVSGRRVGVPASPALSLYTDEPYIDLQGHALVYEARVSRTE